ncbi:MAG: Uma2 family endonuclease [Gammaproteobacteria bacterium]
MPSRGRLAGSISSDFKVKVGADSYYPDVSVACEKIQITDRYTESPALLVEVLSPSTAHQELIRSGILTAHRSKDARRDRSIPAALRLLDRCAVHRARHWVFRVQDPP